MPPDQSLPPWNFLPSLRKSSKTGTYTVIPLTVLKRFDSVLADTKDKVLEILKQHCYDAKNSNDTSILHEAIRKYGEDSFAVEILEDNIEEEMLNEREIFWIKFYDTYHYDNPKNYGLYLYFLKRNSSYSIGHAY